MLGELRQVRGLHGQRLLEAVHGCLLHRLAARAVADARGGRVQHDGANQDHAERIGRERGGAIHLGLASPRALPRGLRVLASGRLASEEHQPRAVPDEGIRMIAVRSQRLLAERHAAGQARGVAAETGEEVRAHEIIEAIRGRGDRLRARRNGKGQHDGEQGKRNERTDGELQHRHGDSSSGPRIRGRNDAVAANRPNGQNRG